MSGRAHPDWLKLGKDWPNNQASRFEQVGATRWHYQRMGKGPVMLLLHGAGAATHTWRDLLPLLAQHFDVIAPDLPGHGFTRVQSRRQCSLPRMAGAIVELMEHLGLRPAVITGHSAGAAIALWSGLNCGLVPQRMIGLNPALTPFRGISGLLFPPLAKALALNPLVPWAFATLARGPGAVDRLIEGTGSHIDGRGRALYAKLIARSDHVDGALSMMALWNLDPLLEDLGRLSFPVDLFVGGGDLTVPPAEAVALGQQFDHITVHRIPRLGHLMHEEDPGDFARRITELCK